MLNNPFDSLKRQWRYSSRFRSSPSYEEEQNDLHQKQKSTGIPILSSLTNNPWSNKRGPSDKPELLTCIKFVGNKAEKFFANDEFTQFNTIDNEGVYYHLCVLDMHNQTEAGVHTNGQNHDLSDVNSDNGDAFM